MNDLQGGGIFRTTTLGAIYSYHLQATDELFFNAGLMVGFIQRKLNTGELIFPDMIDPVNGISFTTQEIVTGYNRNNIDFSFGLTGNYREFFFGLAAHHLNQPQLSNSNLDAGILKRRYSFHAGYNINLGKFDDNPDNLRLTPHLMYEMQGPSRHMILGINGSRKPVVFGVRFRQEFLTDFDAVILLAGFSMNGWTLAYSYDLSPGRYGVTRSISGAHEVSFTLAFNYPEKKKRIRAIKCPAI
jgi:type IX secretion system PorP/SprF family membrane protein